MIIIIVVVVVSSTRRNRRNDYLRTENKNSNISSWTRAWAWASGSNITTQLFISTFGTSLCHCLVSIASDFVSFLSRCRAECRKFVFAPMDDDDDGGGGGNGSNVETKTKTKTKENSPRNQQTWYTNNNQQKRTCARAHLHKYLPTTANTTTTTSVQSAEIESSSDVDVDAEGCLRGTYFVYFWLCVLLHALFPYLQSVSKVETLYKKPNEIEREGGRERGSTKKKNEVLDNLENNNGTYEVWLRRVRCCAVLCLC